MELYSLTKACELLGITAVRLRYWMRKNTVFGTRVYLGNKPIRVLSSEDINHLSRVFGSKE